jgi:acyl carrier protein
MSSDRGAEILVLLTQIFRDTFDDQSIELTYASTAMDIEPWNSLSNVELLVAIEEKMGIRFSSADIADLSNVGELAELIAREKP